MEVVAPNQALQRIRPSRCGFNSRGPWAPALNSPRQITMRAKFAIGLLVLIWVSLAGGETLPDHCAILPVSEGPALIKQCSRSSPTNVSDYWSPSPSQVIAIEKLLPELIRKSGHKLNLSGSYRQYLGVTRQGKKVIYLNSFPRAVAESAHLDWRTKALVICDGGAAFWGVEFDPDDNTFHNLEFNGFV
jgi:hypothetical protein